MQINKVSTPAVEARGPAPQANVRTVIASQDQAVFDQSQSLNGALAASPDVREADVARAKELISSLKYPPDEVIRGIARLLAFAKDRSQS